MEKTKINKLKLKGLRGCERVGLSSPLKRGVRGVFVEKKGMCPY